MVEAIDRAVDAGMAPTRAAVVARAVAEWLARHGEEAIVASYRGRYVEVDPSHEALVGAVSAFSVAAVLAVDEQ